MLAYVKFGLSSKRSKAAEEREREKESSRSGDMFSDTVQPSVVSLFSSTSSEPLALFSTHVDLDLPEDSGLILLRDCDDQRVDIAANDATLLQRDPKQFQLRSGCSSRSGLVRESVLHLQSPTIKTTYIHSPPLPHTEPLDIHLPYIHFQFRPIGAKPFVFEVGVQDTRGRKAKLRISNFQSQPTLYLRSSAADPLLHVPISMRESDVLKEVSQTPWRTVSLALGRLMPHLNNPKLLSLASSHALAAPKGTTNLERFEGFQSITYVKVHANVRLRRIWCTQEPDPQAAGGLDGRGLDELELFAAEVEGHQGRSSQNED